MKSVKFIVEKGEIDSMGNMIAIDGLRFNNETLLTKNFDVNQIVGSCKVEIVDNVLTAEAELPDELLSAYPAIGYKVLSSEPNKHGGRNIIAAELYSVSLCQMRNVDPTIKSVGEQSE